MTLRMTPEMVAASYDYLNVTRPYTGWNLPSSEDVTFRVVSTPNLRGWYRLIKGHHVIAVSRRNVGSTLNLMRVVAHEMLHLYLRETGMENGSMHSAAFVKLGAVICREHGWDPLDF